MPIKEFESDLRTSAKLRLIFTSKVTIDLALLSSQFVGGQGLRFDIEEDFVREAQSNRMPLLAINNFAQFNFPYLSQFEVSASGSRFRDPLSTTFSSNCQTDIVGDRLRFLSEELISEFQLTGALRINPTINANLVGTFAQTVNASAKFTNNAATLTATTSLSVDAAVYPAIENVVDTTYISNTRNADVFGPANMVDIPGVDQSNDVFDISCTSPDGTLGAFLDEGPRSYNNVLFGNVDFRLGSFYFWPDRNFTGDTTVTLTITKQGSYTITRQINVVNIGTAEVPTDTLTFNQNDTWNPSALTRKYNIMDYLVVAGGGGGGADGETLDPADSTLSGGGGGAGRAIYVTGQPINSTSYSVVVGSGGAGGFDAMVGTSTDIPGEQGGNSSFAGISAEGGTGGLFGTFDNAPNPDIYTGGDGGDVVEPDPQDPFGFTVIFSGGAGHVTTTYGPGGGGGAGAGGPGQSATSISGAAGGIGVTNDISGVTQTYAEGGPGGSHSGGGILPRSTAPGSGGAGASRALSDIATEYYGNPGVVIVKIY